MKPKLIKVITVVGTRPEIIKLSRVIALLDKFTDHILVHTGQNYDKELNEIFFDEMKIRKPDFQLKANTSSLASTVADILQKTEAVLIREKPDAFLVLGDTNSSLSAYVAKRMHIPVFHMEAGNRSFDINVPEEINRKIVDHLSDFNLVYSENARQHLIAEGLSHRRIYLTGSPMKEVFDFYLPQIKKSKIVSQLRLKNTNYLVFSAHRQEHVDNPEILKHIIEILNRLADEFNLPIIVSTHPRTKKRMDELKSLSADNRIRFMKPFGFFDYVQLQRNAFCTVSDSGTISEESSILNFPAVSMRQSMERPEAQDSGSIILTGLNPQRIIDSIRIVTHPSHIESNKFRTPESYSINDTSWRVLKLIQGNAMLSNKWWGLNNA